MDGNLLDPEAADETLAKDWNLPELPEGVQYKNHHAKTDLHADIILNKAHLRGAAVKGNSICTRWGDKNACLHTQMSIIM